MQQSISRVGNVRVLRPNISPCYMGRVVDLLLVTFAGNCGQGWTKCKIFLEYGLKLCQKCDFFTNFQIFFERKRQKYPSKLYISPQNAKISLQKHIFPRNEMTKFHILSMHDCGIVCQTLGYGFLT